MRFIMCAVLCVVACSCGGKGKNSNSSRQEEQYPAISAISECSRAKEVRGSNSVFQLVKASPGDLQSIVINSHNKTISYREATAGEDLKGETKFTYKPRKFFFKTRSKNLLLSFPDRATGLIENDLMGKEYVVSILTYNDGSGFHDPFLCTMP